VLQTRVSRDTSALAYWQGRYVAIDQNAEVSPPRGDAGKPLALPGCSP
jgi:hypothetical protein